MRRQSIPDNNPTVDTEEEKFPVARVRRGQAFHRDVQSSFLAGLVGGEGGQERRIRLRGGRNGRADLVVVPATAEAALIITEIRGTDWDRTPASVRRRTA